MKPLCYLNRAKGNAADMIGAFAEGSGAEVTAQLEFVPGREAVFWGVDQATLPIWQEVLRTGTPYWYVDNGYFCSKWAGGDYYRVTRNAEQCGGAGESDGLRWRSLGLAIAPWRRAGKHILIACQSDFWHQRHSGMTAAQWGGKVAADLQRHTQRPIVIRGKPIGGHREPPVAEHLNDCWAVVTYSSIVAAEALLAGIPAFMLSAGAMGTVASMELAEIERPFYPEDRERWAGVLADNQWRLSEIRAGAAWRALNAA